MAESEQEPKILGQENEHLSVSFEEKDLTRIDNIIKELIEDAAFVRTNSFGAKISEIYEAFKKVVQNELKLVGQCSKLKALNDSNRSKLDHAIRLAEIDRKTREDLLEEVEKAWRQATNSKNKEKRTMETNNSLKLEITNLSKLIEQGVGVTMGQEYDVREKNKELENLNAMLEQSSTVIDELKKRIETLEGERNELNHLVKEKETQVFHINRELTSAHLGIQKEQRIVEKLHEEVASMKRLNDNKDNGISVLNQTIQVLRSELAALDAALRDSKIDLDKSKNELSFQMTRYHKLETDLNRHIEKHDALSCEFDQQSRVLLLKENQLEKLNLQICQIQHKRDELDKQVKQLELDKSILVQQNKDFFKSTKELDGQINMLKSEKTKDKVECASMAKDLEASMYEVKSLKNLVKIHTTTIKKLRTSLKEAESSISQLELSNSKLNKVITGFDKERTSFASNLQDLGSRVNKLMDEIGMKELELIDARKMIKDLENKYEVLKSLYKSVRGDRNTYSKNSVESQKMISELNAEISRLRDQSKIDGNLINYNKSELHRLVNEASKSKAQSESMKSRFEKQRIKINQLELKIKNHESTESRLSTLILSQDGKLETLKKELEINSVRVKILGTQLVRRNDEIFLLYQKIKLLEGILQRGEQAYRECSSRLVRANSKLQQLEREKRVRLASRQSVRKLEQQLYDKTSKLKMEKAKVEIIEDLKTKLNVHRWRQLQGRDPTMYHLILKVNLLQKTLIAKTQMVSTMELRLQQKDRIFVEVKKSLARRLVSNDQACVIEEYKRTIRNLKDKLKAALAERNMFCTQLNEPK